MGKGFMKSINNSRVQMLLRNLSYKMSSITYEVILDGATVPMYKGDIEYWASVVCDYNYRDLANWSKVMDTANQINRQV